MKLRVFFAASLHFAAAIEAAPLSAATAGPPVVTPLFVPSDRHPCFRQPAILNAGGTLLAFAENRNVSACAPELSDAASDLDLSDSRLSAPFEVGSMLLRRSTDGGETWLPMQTLLVGNIDFYSLVYDAKSHTVWLMVSHSGTTVLSSKDAGSTWESMPSLDREALSRPPITLTGPAVGHGIQIDPGLCATPCKDAGRLVLPFVCTNTSAKGTHSDQGCTTCNSCLLLSDDGGKTWSLGAIGQQGTRESQVVQIPSLTADAQIYGTERNMGAKPGHRQWGRSNDGGSTYSSTGTESSLSSPVTAHWTGIVGSIQSLDAGKVLVYGGPASPSLRSKMAVHISKDSGKTWSPGKTVWNSFAGYSDMAPLNDGAGLIMILENGNKTFADCVSVAKLSTSWLDSP